LIRLLCLIERLILNLLGVSINRFFVLFMIKLKALLVFMIFNKVSGIFEFLIISLIEFRSVPWALMMTVGVSQGSFY